MALEYTLTLKSLNSKVTVIGSNPAKRELVLGFEDGYVQTYDYDTGIINMYYHSILTVDHCSCVHTIFS
jgi:hypothetical protein